MRVALVSPYSWSYPGGVTRHIEALAGELRAGGHEVCVLAPFDPVDALARRMHRGVSPQRIDRPEGFVSLGRTVGIPANGAVSNLALSAHAPRTMRRELRSGYDVVHIHEPVVPIVGWDAMVSTRGGALVGTYHTFSENALTNGLGRLLGARRRMANLHLRIAVSEAAAWTGRRFFGGEYAIVPNGVSVEPVACGANDRPGVGASRGREDGAAPGGRRALQIIFIGQPVARKGLPVLLSAFEALREQLPVELTLIGTDPEEIAPLLLECRGVRALGRVSDRLKRRALAEADVLCAPSLHGESFGMVLTEAFAAGLPVVASDIHGYRDVARDGVDGLLVAPGDPLALAEALRAMATDLPMRSRMAAAAADRAQRFAWKQVAGEVLACYRCAIETAAQGAPARAGARLAGAAAPGTAQSAAAAVDAGEAPVAADERGTAEAGCRADGRLPARAPRATARGGIDSDGRRARLLPRWNRRTGLLASSLLVVGLALAGFLDIGVGSVEESLAASKPGLLLAGFLMMAGAMSARALAWHLLLRATAGPPAGRLRDAMQGTAIGVLMSATLPARLGEPSRALIVARRLGSVRERLPQVLTAQVAQMLLNLAAVCMLGIGTALSARQLQSHDAVIAMLSAVPVAGLLLLGLAPLVLPGGLVSRARQAEGLPAQVGAALRYARSALQPLRRLPWAPLALAVQLIAWGVQLLACWLVLAAVGLAGDVDLAGVGAVLFAINATALLPATPGNVGIFQIAVLAVLAGVYRVSGPAALAYGLALQSAELLVAAAVGLPALAREGITWRELRTQSLHALPVQLRALPADIAAAPAEAALEGAGGAGR